MKKRLQYSLSSIVALLFHSVHDSDCLIIYNIIAVYADLCNKEVKRGSDIKTVKLIRHDNSLVCIKRYCSTSLYETIIEVRTDVP
jgi:hypothetical protein